MKNSLSAKELQAICDLPVDFHGAGVMSSDVLRMMARLLADQVIACSAETGAGKTTLLFSRLSEHHLVFALDRFDGFDNGSMSAVQGSQLFRTERVEFIVGPTQSTLPHHEFKQPLDVVLIDGPHGYPFPELEYYYFYPQLRAGGWLFLDDIHIPSIWHLFEFLVEDEMFELVEVCAYTAAFRRTEKPLFDPRGDGWWLQAYNQRRQAQLVAELPQRLQSLQSAQSAAEASGISERAGWQGTVYRFVRRLFGADLARRLHNAWRAFRV